MTINRIRERLLFCGALCALLLGFTACDDSQSYSELLRDEEKAVNWYLADCRVEPSIPADGNFETGENAPFYKMDADGYLYMQVVNPGTSDPKPESGDRVYFRFMRKNIKYLYEGYDLGWDGNANDMNNGLGSTYIILDNYQVPSSAQYGTGIQEPLKYVGYDSEVNLVISSTMGFNVDQSSCLPYIYNVKYFKAEY